VALGLLTPWIVAEGFRVGVRELADGLHGREGGKTLEIAWTEVGRFVYQEVAFYAFVVVERRDGTRSRPYGAKRLMRWRHGRCTDDFAALLNQRLAEQSAPLTTRSPCPFARPATTRRTAGITRTQERLLPGHL